MMKPAHMLVIFAAGAFVVSGTEDIYAQGTLLDRGREFLRKWDGPPVRPAKLTEAEIADGLREALQVGAERVVEALGTKNGFNSRSDIHIPLPKSLAKVQSTLARFGVSHVADDLELRLNRAAEAAVPRAKRMFQDAIRDMSLRDVRSIFEGPDDSATRYFRGKMVAPLTDKMQPIVNQELVSVGAIRAFDEMMQQYRSFPFVPDAKADLTGHVLKRAVDGVFLYLAREEAAIRKDPVKRTTALLKRVFTGR